MEAELLTVETLAARLGRSPDTLAYWRKCGTGPRWMKLGRRIQYRKSDVDSWLEEQYVGTEKPEPAA